MRRTRVLAVRGSAWAAACVVLLLALVPPRPAAADDGPWEWPLAGPREVSRAFAPPEHAYGAGHRGADLPSAAGAVVRAAGAGRVSYAGLLAGRGVVVVVHGDLRTTYEPVRASVGVGDLVARGEPVGTLDAGHLGCPAFDDGAAACLHWGLRRGEEYLDPLRLVERGPIRLLPVTPVTRSSLRAGAWPGAGLSGDEPSGAGSSGGGASAAAALARGGRTGPGPLTAGAAVRSGDHVPSAGSPAAPPSAAPAAPSGWRLRAADAPLGALAVVALVAGIGLLARPRPDPGRPPGAGAGRAAPPDVVELEDPPGPVAPVLELDVERLRRRAG